MLALKFSTAGLQRAATRASVNVSSRLMSLDALRGFDMIWIVGGDAVMQALGKVAGVQSLPPQFEHTHWSGMTFYDLIFPLFIFICGVSLVFSVSRMLERMSRADAVKRILLRGGILFLLGLLYNGGLTQAWPDVRLMGVLQRIGLVYAAAGVLFVFFKPRALVAIFATLLMGYWALLTFVPIRNVSLDQHTLEARFGRTPSESEVKALYDTTTVEVTGRYEPGLNLTSHIDYRFLPGERWLEYSDSEGLLSTLPAIASGLLGVLIGLWLRRSDVGSRRKVEGLFAAGLASLAVGLAWSLQFPLIKNIWSSSFVLVAGGWSILLLTLFYYVIDVLRWRTGWSMLLWVGMNPILLYLVYGMFDFQAIAHRFVGGSVSQFFDDLLGNGGGGLISAAAALGLILLLARFLYGNRIFLRV